MLTLYYILCCIIRKIPRDMTKASRSGDRILILATLFMLLLSGMVLRATGFEVHSGLFKPGDDTDEDHGNVSISLSSNNFDQYYHKYPILVVSFYAPWCYWSKRLRPAWEKAAKIIRERYDPEMDGRIMIGKVDCTEQTGLCNRNHIQGYPSIRIFRNGSDVRDGSRQHDHESYYGDRDSESLVAMMESLIAPIQKKMSVLIPHVSIKDN
ncbi:unnamed protein product [Rhodiola kirilowii]